MIYEFALEPALVARWHDRKEYLFFDEKFGLRSRRIVSAYPKNWKKMIWEIFESGPASDNQNARMRMTEMIQFIWQNAIRRPSTFPEISVWLEKAEAEHAERPFRAIIATENPRNQNFVIAVQDLLENGHELWNIPLSYPTARTAQEIASAVSPLIRICRHAILVDPYFDPTKLRFRQTLAAILHTCNDSVCGKENLQVELHTSIDRFFETWERGVNRNPNEESKAYSNFVLECQNHLPELVPAAINLKVIVWKQKVGGENLHNRYLLTNLFGAIFGTGSDEADNPSSVESDDIVPLEEGQYMTRYQQYSSTNPAFDMVGQPFIITN